MGDAPSWRILIANVTLASRTGTETVVRDLALGLLAAGQRPMVYSRRLGDIADEIRSSGVPVVSALEDVPETPDIIHGHHHVETVESLLHFPTTRGLFVCHDRRAHTSFPPRMGSIRRYVAVDFNCLERLTDEYGLPGHLTRVIYNSVDPHRFLPRPDLPLRPRRALVFSNYAGPGTHVRAVQEACGRLNISLDVIGSGSGNSCQAPEQVLGEYDLVFAKARCALEAMAVGTAVVLCDATGLGPLVSMGEVDHLRRWNFGMRLLSEPLEPAGIVRQVERYDPTDARAVSTYIRQHASTSGSIDQYLRLYREIMEGPPRTAATTAEDLHEYLQHLAGRVGELELQLAEYRRPDRMEPLSDRECARIALLIKECPAEAVCAGTVHVRVELENGTSQKLGSYPPCPVQFSYRWLKEETGEVVVAEGSRTVIRPSLAPAEKGTYMVGVVAPDEPGCYRLRLTLVQEWVRWLDLLECPIRADAAVSVIRTHPPDRPDARAH
jgi:hypothetical protein